MKIELLEHKLFTREHEMQRRLMRSVGRLLRICILAAHAPKKEHNVDLLSWVRGSQYIHNVHAQTRWRIYIESSQVGFIVACVHDISWADIDFALFGSGILDRVYCVCALSHSWGKGESRRARCRSCALCIGINIMAHRKQLALGAQSPHL
jgi:hypothetical protein